MNYKILKLSFLFFMISSISSSKENINVSISMESICATNACMQKGNEYGFNSSAIKKAAIENIVKETEEDAAAENEVLISPISRFILLQ